MDIVVATDFSERAGAALPEAVRLAAAAGGSIRLLHVATARPWPAAEAARARAELTEHAAGRLRELRDRGVQGRVPCETEVVQGTPHEEVVRVADRRRADLIVVASHGHSGLKRYLLGSTTERIIRSAPCSVLVVRPAAAPAAAGSGAAPKIVVGTDFSAGAADAAGRAVEVARQRGAELLLVHVVQDADYPARMVLQPLGFPHVLEGLRKRSQARLRAFREEHVPGDVRATTVLLDGVPSARIADTAAESGAVLVVVGAVGQAAGGRFALGSTAERVARGAPCPVLVVKARAASAV